MQNQSASSREWKWRKGPFCIGDPGSWYNGYSWEERTAVTPIQKQATAAGIISQPTVCGVTGISEGYVYQHNEDYSRPLEFYAVARFVHSALHARFTDPLPWNRLVRKHYRHGAWFTFLTMAPTDMTRPFAEVYPQGLPADGQDWPELATALGITPATFATTKAEASLHLQTENPFRALST